ncbi:GumC family protein [Novosphingobium mangrovi (ex Huang et al. 2023)]|uniref:Polysaccharide biosynthesis tyrosine autokinase n=1 Tax=Novosphingobium mangrovi (ex Huang et al. 2023) TaxID=2976432 RepID=A0ABT2HZU5_9SPHN|nr:polysaccharide biosynthesis tyrosine autokinase [Novosphingobium mangrovi (ex Huang et al. 2023)]MCT2398074.1 polysaccharide biosynthesis tyrosine autokinase [Novosphingobium mangrovi (ex Huang et al. 2023)]
MTDGVMMNGDEGSYVGSFEERDQLLGIDLKQILSAVRRNVKWIALIVIGVLIAGFLVTLLMVPRYIATAQVLVEQTTDTIIEGSELQDTANQQFDAERFLETQVDIIRSRSLAERVAQSAKLVDRQAFYDAMGEAMPQMEDLDGANPTKSELADLRLDTVVELLQEHLSVVLPVDSRVIKIQFESTDAATSAQIANLYAENYLESNLKRKFESSAYARQFLANQLAEARSKVEASERELNQYSRAAGLIRISGQGQNADRETTLSVTNNSLVQVNSAAAAATADRLAAEDRWNTIAKEPVLSIPQVIENAAIQDILKQKATLEAQLADEQSRHLDDYPSVKVLKAQISELNKRINTIGGGIKRSIYLEFSSSRAREDSLKTQVEKLRDDAMGEQERGVGYAVLKRVAETDRALYDTLLERYNQLNATAGSTSNNVTLVDRADVPREPSSPSLILNLFVALVLGLGGAGLFVLLREHFDDTVRSPEDVEAKLGLPLLGLIPAVPEGEAAAAADDVKSSLSEAYHSLVANLRFSTSNGFPRVLVVTSTNESEGKTTSAHSVAVDLARLGKSVLLIDADLRRPTLHRRMAEKNVPGLTELLVGDASFDAVLHPSGFDHLTYMTGLPIPPEPSLLLGGDRLPRVIEEATARFDVVVVDSAPMLGLSDTASIASLTDGVLFVIDASRFHRGAVKSALRRLSMVNAKIIGAVVTKFDARSANGDYAYYGYNYYSYGSDRSSADA